MRDLDQQVAELVKQALLVLFAYGWNRADIEGLVDEAHEDWLRL